MNLFKIIVRTSVLSGLFFFLSFHIAQAQSGEQIFKQNCASCHALDKNLSGPALRGVEGRGPWGDRKNFYAWVKNPAAFIPTTPYTQDLQKTYGSIMPGFPELQKEDVDAIVDYISAY